MNELIIRAQNGDREAEEQIIRENDGLIRSIMKKYGYSTFDEDMHSIGMFNLWRAIKTFDLDKGYKFSTYACIIMENGFKMEKRKQLNSKNVIMQDYISFDTIVHENLTVSDFIKDSKAEVGYLIAEYPNIDEILHVLTDLERQIFELRYVYGYKQNEIKEKLGLTWSQSYIARVIGNIRAKLANEAGIEYTGYTTFKRKNKNKESKQNE